jgi:ribosomal protein S18 acetylase RimI-like enzyme
MWIAESDGEVVGMTILGPDTEDPSRVELDSLYVAREKQGIGTSLLEKARESQPSDDVVLWCAANNHRARGYYENEKRGFQLDGRTKTWVPLSGVYVPQLGYRWYRGLASAP